MQTEKFAGSDTRKDKGIRSHENEFVFMDEAMEIDSNVFSDIFFESFIFNNKVDFKKYGHNFFIRE